MAKSNMGRKGLIWLKLYTTKGARIETPGRTLEAGTEAKTMEE